MENAQDFGTTVRVMIPLEYRTAWNALPQGGRSSLVSNLLKRAIIDDRLHNGDLIPRIVMGVARWNCTLE